MSSEIMNYLNQLQGKYLSNIGRAGNIIWLNFVDTVVEMENIGKDIPSGSLCLHVQCPCRMIDKENRIIIFASSDIYIPKSSLEWSEDFEWDIKGNNLFDEKSMNWLLSKGKVYINNYKFNIFGDLKLTLSNGVIFEVLINSSSNDECWRLFEKSSDKDHFVVTGQKVIFEFD